MWLEISSKWAELIFIKDGCRRFIFPSPFIFRPFFLALFFLRPFFKLAIYSKILKTYNKIKRLPRRLYSRRQWMFHSFRIRLRLG
jgi:hypothetical protein